MLPVPMAFSRVAPAAPAFWILPFIRAEDCCLGTVLFIGMRVPVASSDRSLSGGGLFAPPLDQTGQAGGERNVGFETDDPARSIGVGQPPQHGIGGAFLPEDGFEVGSAHDARKKT